MFAEGHGLGTMVFHGSTLGVTEYSSEFNGLADGFQTTPTGLFAVGGDLDDEAPFVGRFAFGAMSDDSRLKRYPDRCYVQAECEGAMRCEVTTLADGAATYTYEEGLRTGRNRRFIFGRGIRDSYIGLAFSNPGGEAFRVDSVELVDRSTDARKV